MYIRVSTPVKLCCCYSRGGVVDVHLMSKFPSVHVHVSYEYDYFGYFLITHVAAVKAREMLVDPTQPVPLDPHGQRFIARILNILAFKPYFEVYLHRCFDVPASQLLLHRSSSKKRICHKSVIGSLF